MNIKKALAGGGLLLLIVLGSMLNAGLMAILFLVWLDVFVLRRFYHLGLFGIETVTVGMAFLGMSFGPLIGFFGGLFLPGILGIALLLTEAGQQKDSFSAPTFIDPVSGVVGGVAGVFSWSPLLAIAFSLAARVVFNSTFIFATNDEVPGIFYKTVPNMVNAGLTALLFFYMGPAIFF